MGSARFTWLFLVLCALSSMTIAQMPPNMPRICYTSKGKLSESYVMPCLNNRIDDGNVYACCIAGDDCLANGACFDSDRGITYQKGCTDDEYDDINCPHKCGTNQNLSDWVGLVYCSGSNGTPKDSWICHHPDNCLKATNCPPSHGHWDPQLEVTRKTECKDLDYSDRWVAFHDGSPIQKTATLPKTDGVEKWWSDYSNYSTRWIPSSSPTSAPTNLHTSTSLTSLTSEATTEASVLESSQPGSSDNFTAGPPQETSSSKGSNIGLAAGLGAGIPLLLAGIGFLVYYLRRRHNEAGAGESFKSWLGSNQGDGTTGGGKPKDSSGETAELPAEERPNRISEMEGSGIKDVTPMQSPTVSPLLAQDSVKDEKHEHRVSGGNKSPVYELAG